MKLPQKSKERKAALILIGLLGGVVTIIGFLIFLNSKKPEKISIEQALWVTDFKMEQIYEPGSPVQQKIVKQLGGHLDGNLEFNAPVLYRMGLKASDTSEGFILYGFDPDHPEMAKKLLMGREP